MRLALSPCSIQSAAVAWRSACSAYFAFGAGGGLSPSWRLRFIGYPTYPCFASPRGSRRMLRYQFRPLEGHTAPTPGGRLFGPPRTRDLRSTRSTCAGWVEGHLRRGPPRERQETSAALATAASRSLATVVRAAERICRVDESRVPAG